jgi:hypothetical protein
MKKKPNEAPETKVADVKQPKKLTRATLEALTACAGGRPYPVKPS